MSILAQILADKVPEVARAKRERPLAEVEAAAKEAPTARCMATALRRGPSDPIRVIAEFKRASPSAGAIFKDAIPEDIAKQYEAGGASAISVLTEEKYFDGRLSFLPRIRAVVDLPLLRKDFVIDAYQVVEARANGADAVLLIASALDDSALRELYSCVRAYGMRALVEVHDEEEAERAVAVGAEIIGVNHRNLATFEIDLGLTVRLRKLLPEDAILVGESGIRTAQDACKLRADGAHAILVGESLMRADSPANALELLRKVP